MPSCTDARQYARACHACRVAQLPASLVATRCSADVADLAPARSLLCRGFKLLAAMGYQQGQRIGKEGTGLAEPLPLLLKQDKLGLGAVSKKAAAREEQRRREAEARDTGRSSREGETLA